MPIRLLILLMVWQCLMHNHAMAQLEPQFTQFMYNKQFYNPASAGSEPAPMVQLMYRKQWIGLEGAPTTGQFSWQKAVLSNRVGVGTNLQYNAIGIHKRMHGDLSYSYNAPLLNGFFYGGLQASFRYFQQNWADPRLFGSQSLATDQAIPNVLSSKIVPNFGAGVYFTTEKYFVGLSVPRLVKNSIDFAELGGTISREDRPFYFMAGYHFKASEKLKITTQCLGNYVNAQPFEFDINALATINDKFVGGLTYRTIGDHRGLGESVDVLVGFFATEKLQLTASYDITMSKIRRYSAGSVELTARYYLRTPGGNTDTNDVVPVRVE